MCQATVASDKEFIVLITMILMLAINDKIFNFKYYTVQLTLNRFYRLTYETAAI